jgi:hypothetical protein
VSHPVVEIEGSAQTGDIQDVPVPARQPTGDHAVDEVLEKLDTVSDQPLDSQIGVIEQVHRVLQGRLADLGEG